MWRTESVRACAAVALLAGAGTGLAQHRMTLTNVTLEVGMTSPHIPAMGMGAGACAVDVDEDGDIDIFAPTRGGHAHLLYVNQGDGTFTEEAAARGHGRTREAGVVL